MIEKNNISTIEWVEKIRLDVNGSLRQLYLLYRKSFEQWILQKFDTIQSEDVKDIYQDSILAVYENIKNRKFTGTDCTLKTYLYSIGRNVTLNHLKKSKSINEYHIEDDLMNIAIDRESLKDFFEKINLTNTNERTQKILKTLNNLKSPCKEIIMLYYFERLSMQEISEKLAYNNANVVKAQKYRCMSKLLSFLSKL